MAGQIIITVDASEEGGFKVPSVSVGADPDGKPFVWLIDKPDNTVSKRYVTLAEATGEDVSIVEGLAVGDIVVTAGLSALREDMRVRPVSKIGD